MRTRPANTSDIDKIVEIHYKRFSSFFLTTLGKDFLKIFYKAFLAPPGILLVIEEEGKIMGFAAGSYSNKGFFKKLLFNNLSGFCKIGIIIILTNFAAFKRLMFNASKSGKNNMIYAELLSIATVKNNKGYGKFLLKFFEKRVTDMNSNLPISLTTDFENNNKAITFYKDAGYEVFEIFNSYNDRKMIRFIKNNN